MSLDVWIDPNVALWLGMAFVIGMAIWRVDKLFPRRWREEDERAVEEQP